MIRRILITCGFLSFLFHSHVLANNLTISNASYDESTHSLTFDVSWQNAFTFESTPGVYSFDGAWIFIKYAPNGGPTWQHVNVVSAVVESLEHVISGTGTGIMVYPNLQCGDCDIQNKTITLQLEPIIGSHPDFKIFGLEMVNIPQEPFYLGDGFSQRTFYTYPDTLTPYHVQSADEIIAGETIGNINKKGFSFTTNIPADYPKGYRSFWTMKYKVTMEQYVGFLNTLSRDQQDARTETDLSPGTITNVFVMTNTAFPYKRHPIRCDTVPASGPIDFYCDLNNNAIPNESDDGQNLIMHTISGDDIMAYLDWAGMRPLTKLEFIKMCRGPLYPVSGDYAWGTSGYIAAANLINSGQASETYDNVGSDPIWPGFGNSGFQGARAGFAATNNSSRLSAGATYYGVMDVHSGGITYHGTNYWNTTNIHYYNSQGDGMIAINGDSNVPGWRNNDMHFRPSYSYDGISDGFLSYATARASFRSFRGAIRLQP